MALYHGQKLDALHGDIVAAQCTDYLKGMDSAKPLSRAHAPPCKRQLLHGLPVVITCSTLSHYMPYP